MPDSLLLPSAVPAPISPFSLSLVARRLILRFRPILPHCFPLSRLHTSKGVALCLVLHKTILSTSPTINPSNIRPALSDGELPSIPLPLYLPESKPPPGTSRCPGLPRQRAAYLRPISIFTTTQIPPGTGTPSSHFSLGWTSRPDIVCGKKRSKLPRQLGVALATCSTSQRPVGPNHATSISC